MKRVMLIVLIILLVGIFSFLGVQYFSSFITGLATSSGIGFNITITGEPTLTIESVKNGTYLNNVSLLFRADSNANNLWYNLDHGENTSVLESGNSNKFTDFFDISQGQHTLYVFANNTDGLTKGNVSFVVNNGIFAINYSKYSGDYKGASTDFYQYSFEELQNLTNVTLEHTLHGKIVFNGTVNVTNSGGFSSNITDLNSNTNISPNRIELDSSVLEGFNEHATLSIYNLSFANPRILKDGNVCSSGCKENYYSGGIFSFNVTSFSVYSVEETVGGTTSTTGSSTSSGSGNLVREIASNLNVDKEIINLKLNVGQTASRNVIIKNEGSVEENVVINVEKIEDLVKVSNDSFTLDPGEQKEIILDFIVREETRADLYVGKIIVVSGNYKKEVLIFVEVESGEALFDVVMNVVGQKANYELFGHLIVIGSRSVSANVGLYEVSNAGRVDVIMNYAIRTTSGDVVASETETLAVSKQANFVRTLDIPADSPEGEYFYYVSATVGNATASASKLFRLEERDPSFEIIVYIIFGIIVLFLIILFIEIARIKRHHKKLFCKNEKRVSFSMFVL